jgi:membrane protease YdiL (CAAX protease family)
MLWITARALLLFFLWQMAALLFVVMNPFLAAVWLAVLALLFLRLYAVPGWLSGAMVALARPRPIHTGRRWVWAMVPVVLVVPMALTFFLMAVGLVDPEPLPEMLQRYAERPGGAVVLLLMIVGIAPLFEEFAFRGWMQRPLERRLGAGPAIGVTAVVFAVAHFQGAGVPVRIVAGVILGYVVWATRSVWSGVLLHAAWNAGVLLLAGVFVDFDPTGRGWEVAAPAGAISAAALGAFAWIAVRMGREPGAPRP